ncbi:uncharacterized protein ACNLHF_015353 [Anomaloglossus baeobatrachus]|uniref:uncharacterized protein LOC142298822 n=1 Tax=Anomaloglossus baeobatrachus TaxID=238106 RepID=UPI003F4F7800
MGSRELRRLIEDNEAWLRRPENQRQARIVYRLRSSERHLRRHQTNRGRESNAINERGRRQTRGPPQHRRQENISERSRSPLSHIPMECTESSRITGDSSCDESSVNTNTVTFQPPSSIPQICTPSRQVPAPGRTMGESCRGDSSQASGCTTTEFIFRPPNPIPLNRRLRNVSSPDRTPRESGITGHQFEIRPPNPIPSSARFREFTAVNHLFNILIQMQGMDVRRPTIPQMQSPTRPAQNPALQEIWHPQPNRTTLQINTLQTRTILPQEDNGSCVICLTEFAIGENITLLPCKHIFHQTCIVTWLQSNPSCPLCRKTAC